MEKIILQTIVILSLSIGLSACATQRPVLSPNTHLMRVGSSVAEQEVDDCMRLAEMSSSERGESPQGTAAADTVTSSAVGAAAGGAGGAVVGRAGQGAAAGAAGGAAASLTSAFLRGLFASKPPDPAYRRFVDRCLRERGYEPAGWK
ncbi:MAG TPA: hypothetical protein VFU31_30785 [Candidatus Binatia bacterium]|nr:hypothetical protein [Candidatus Binatia bacterium]